ncbi:GntR family transcriptional regulator [Olsenella sp. Marseille-P4559]|uniref:GntR family transcriptional regulator n=1 Tax=Olsenella sp. Marseille-P4559 TaxID=2364795 RepID=UPI0010321C21|nr:GntR family transcriptional regulator [Olsenella sp. Marseille-P4559]
MPKYKAIVKELIEAIRRGDLKPYDQLPTVVELCGKYHVSRSTVELVMDDLERQGYVSRKRGSGVYVKKVAKSVAGAPLNTIALTDGTNVDLQSNPVCRVHEFTIVKPDSKIIHFLGLHDHSFTYYICRSHMLGDTILDVEYLYYPVEIFRDIRLSSAETSVRSWIEENYEVTPDTYHKMLRAVSPTPEEREILGVESETPLLEIEQVGYLDDGRPFEYLAARFPGDTAVYQTVDSDSLPV